MGDTQQAEQAPTTGPEATSAATDTPKPQAPARAAEKGEDGTDWKAEARKWEQRAKEHSKAAARLAEIEDANKTEAQRAADAQRAAEERAVQAEARALRREVALEHSLSKEDAALLDGITDEEAVRALAARLAARGPDVQTPPAGFGIDLNGRTDSNTPTKDEQARAFFGI